MYNPHSARFTDRIDAGKALAFQLRPYLNDNPVLIAIPNGGAQVGVAIATELGKPLYLIVVRKLQFPDNPEAGFGAVCSDGQLHLNEWLVDAYHIDETIIERQKEKALTSIKSREGLYSNWTELPPLKNRTVILIDDGLASGFTMAATIDSVKKQGAKKVIIAVPTASDGACRLLSPKVDKIICPDIKGGPVFAVANAYRNWRDLPDEEVIQLLRTLP